MSNHPNKFRMAWSLACGLGLGFGFLAALAPDLLEEAKTGIATAPGNSIADFAMTLTGWLAMGAVFGSAQAVVLRSRNVPIYKWIFVTVAGFGAAGVLIDWPLQAAGILGNIPGPVEPIILTHGGGFFAGFLQFLLLRREGISAGKWLGIWIAGLVASLIPAALFFIAIVESLDIILSWSAEIFLDGFIVGGVAALISAKTLFSALSERSRSSQA